MMFSTRCMFVCVYNTRLPFVIDGRRECRNDLEVFICQVYGVVIVGIIDCPHHHKTVNIYYPHNGLRPIPNQ